MTDKLFKAYSLLCATQVRFSIYYYYPTHLLRRSGFTAGALLGLCDILPRMGCFQLLGCFLYKVWRLEQDRQPCGKGNLNITVQLTEYFHLLSQVPAICHATDKNYMWRPAVLKHISSCVTTWGTPRTMVKHISSHVWPHEEHLGLWWTTLASESSQEENWSL